MACEHNWQFQNMVYSEGRQLPGSGACAMVYQDKYYCTKCLDVEYGQKIEKGNNYSSPLSGTFPKG